MFQSGIDKKKTNDKTVIQYKFSDMLNLISVNREAEAKRYSNEERARSATRMKLEIKAAESPNKTVDYVPRKVTLRRLEFYLLVRSKNKYDGF